MIDTPISRLREAKEPARVVRAAALPLFVLSPV